ncbi:MAG: hypothetical protein ACM3SY_02785 [Candidatus Omnitrophota bacterium]
MNQLQLKLIENTNKMPKRFLQEIVDFSEFVKQKAKSHSFKKRMEQSELDVKEGRVSIVKPEELFKEIGI